MSLSEYYQKQNKILEEHGIELNNQGIAELQHILDCVCLNCKHRWGDNGGPRFTCKHCRFFDGCGVHFHKKDDNMN